MLIKIIYFPHHAHAGALYLFCVKSAFPNAARKYIGIWHFLFDTVPEKAQNKIHRFLFYEENIPSKKELNEFMDNKDNQLHYIAFVSYLEKHKLSKVVPKWINQTGNGLEVPPFAIPPEKYWENILPILKLIQKEIYPVI